MWLRFRFLFLPQIRCIFLKKSSLDLLLIANRPDSEQNLHKPDLKKKYKHYNEP